jgi:hypothetical protein
MYRVSFYDVTDPDRLRCPANGCDILMLDKIAKVLDKNFLDLLPSECFQNNTKQKGGISVINLGTFNNLSEKLIEQYEIRLKEKDEIIKDLKK